LRLTRTVQFNPLLFQLVPLVNVLFLVFMLFSMSARFVLQPGVAVTLPYSTFTLAPQRHPQIVSITSAPVPAIYFHSGKVTLEDFGKALESQTPQPKSIILKADRAAPYEMVALVMDEALKRGYSVILAASPEASR